MSKSVGNVVDPIAILKEHGVDNVRWYLARAGGNFKSDVGAPTNSSQEAFVSDSHSSKTGMTTN